MRYEYRHALDNRMYYSELDEQSHHILDAAFVIASLVHVQSRGKIDPDYEDITHPIMACDILYRMGERDPVLLAASLLHDVIEDDSDYGTNEAALKNALVVNLLQEFALPNGAARLLRGQIEDWATRIEMICKHLSRPANLSRNYTGSATATADPEGKEMWQIKSIERMDLNEKKLKLADQAASLICNLTMSNDPKQFSIDKEHEFLEKAHSLGIAIVKSANPDEVEPLKPWANFFGHTLLCAQHLFAFPDGASEVSIARHREKIREEFDFDKLMNDKSPVALVPKQEGIYHHLPLPVIYTQNGHPYGLAQVNFDGKGKIPSCEIWIPQGEGDGDAGRLQKNLTKALRSMLRKYGDRSPIIEEPAQRGILQPDVLMHARDENTGEVIGVKRLYHFVPSLTADDFIAAVRAAGTYGRGQNVGILRTAHNISTGLPPDDRSPSRASWQERRERDPEGRNFIRWG